MHQYVRCEPNAVTYNPYMHTLICVPRKMASISASLHSIRIVAVHVAQTCRSFREHLPCTATGCRRCTNGKQNYVAIASAPTLALLRGVTSPSPCATAQ